MTQDFYNILLVSPAELKQESLINQNVEEKVLNVIIQTAQEIYLCKIIGTPLYRRLQELVYNKLHEDDGNEGDKIDGQGFETYNELLENYVKPYLKYKAVEQFTVENSFKMRNVGVVRNADTNVSYVDLDSIRFLQHHYNTYVAEYEDRLSKFICANKEMLPEVTAEIASYLEPAQVGETFSNTGGLWLGGTKNKGCGSCRR